MVRKTKTDPSAPRLELGTYKGGDMWYIMHLRRRIRTGCIDEASAALVLAAHLAALAKPTGLAGIPLAEICRWAVDGMAYRIEVKRIEGFWPDKRVADVTQASVDALLATDEKSEHSSRQLVRIIARFAEAHGLTGAPIVRFAMKMPKKEARPLSKDEVAGLLWACLGFRFDTATRKKTLIHEDKDRRAALLAERRFIRRVILLAVYTSATREGVRNLRWTGDPNGSDSFVLLPPRQADGSDAWPVAPAQRQIHWLGVDAPVVEKMRVPVTICQRITAHLMRWRRLDDGRSDYVTSRIEGRLHTNYITDGLKGVFEDAGLPVDWAKLQTTFADLALGEGALIRNVAIAMGYAVDTTERLYAHLARDFQQGIVDASSRRSTTLG